MSDAVLEGVRSPCAREDAAAVLATLSPGPFRRVVPVGDGDAAGALHVRQLFQVVQVGLLGRAGRP